MDEDPWANAQSPRSPSTPVPTSPASASNPTSPLSPLTRGAGGLGSPTADDEDEGDIGRASTSSRGVLSPTLSAQVSRLSVDAKPASPEVAKEEEEHNIWGKDDDAVAAPASPVKGREAASPAKSPTKSAADEDEGEDEVDEFDDVLLDDVALDEPAKDAPPKETPSKEEATSSPSITALAPPPVSDSHPEPEIDPFAKPTTDLFAQSSSDPFASDPFSTSTSDPFVQDDPRDVFASSSKDVFATEDEAEDTFATPDDDAQDAFATSGFEDSSDTFASSAKPVAVDPAEVDAGFDDFDDFDAPAPVAEFGDDDDFGDFGDFDDADFAAAAPAEPEPAAAPAPVPAPPVPSWSTLSLRPVPPRLELLERVSAVLEPLVPDPSAFTDEQPRAVGGLSQVLTSESARDVYAQLTTAPMLKPLDWTRSRVRREHLIAMGVPVNLDEVDSHRLSALPPLRITTGDMPPPARAQSADPNAARRARNSFQTAAPAGTAAGASAPASVRNSQTDKYDLGPRPPLDTAKAEELCGLEEEQLALLPLSKLEALQNDLVNSTADASALLAYLLQLKDALAHDSRTYNGMISELIANAAKQKQPSSGGGMFRRASQKVNPRSRPVSVSATPRRTGSPAMFS